MSDYLPQQVVVEILVRLPVKSLIKCITVCKSWRSLVESSAFMDTHLSRQNDNTNLLLLKVGTRDCDLCLLHNPETGESNNLIQSTQTSRLEFDVHGTCNGLICLSSQSHDSHLPYFAIIWNPSIRRFVFLPRPRVVDYENVEQFHAFGFDMPTNDYKVLRIMSYLDRSDVPPNTPYEVEVYSLARGSWKSLSAVVVPKDYNHYLEFRDGVLLNGSLHWFQLGNNRDNFIVTFDMYNEVFCEMVVPDAIKTGLHILCMTRYGESLAIVDMAELDGFEATFHVWVMNKYGVIDSWNVLYSVRLRGLPYDTLRPFGLTRNGEFMIDMFFSGLFYVNYNSCQAVRFAIDGSDWCFVDSFVESLVLLSQANAISY
ncbi:hypothetical protein ACLB2K_055837 [Fragaria x ananassa]